MKSRDLLGGSTGSRRSDRPSRPRTKTFRPRVEELETRLVPYAISGNAWARPELVTISFVPDGTLLGYNNGSPVYSNLFATFNAKFGSASGWQPTVLRAAQVWAQQSNLNFALIADNGGAAGSGDYQQGDPAMGDIRVGGYNFGNNNLATAYMPPPANNYSIAGDFNFNTGQSFNNGTTYDLFTVAAHEFGHALGLHHSTTVSAQQYSAYNGAKSALASDDVGGVRAVYSVGAARANDRFDSSSNNNSFSAATAVSVSSTSLTALVTDLDITTTADNDYFKFTAPSGTSGTLSLRVQSKGLSLLTPRVWVYNSAQSQLAYASGAGQHGTTLSLTVGNIVAGQTYYLRVAGADTSAFSTGEYAVSLSVGSNAPPAVPLPDTRVLKGATPTSGGGVAVKLDYECLVNTAADFNQTLADSGQRATAMDASGNYVVVWASEGQDGSGWGVYGQRFDKDGNRLDGEFRVNTTTAGNQLDPSVAVDAVGNFVVVWTSRQGPSFGHNIYGQRFDASGDKVGGEFRVNNFTAGEQHSPSVAMDSLGNFTVTWTSYDLPGSEGVFAQRFLAVGLRLGSEFRVNSTVWGDQTDSQVAMNGLGEFVVTWSGQSWDGSWDVYVQRYSALGLPLGSESRVNSTGAGDRRPSSVAMDALGNFVVVWAGEASTGWEIYGRRFLTVGLPVGDEFLVNSTTEGDQRDPSVAMTGNGDFMVTWSSRGQDGSGWGIFGQQYALSGILVEGEFQVSTSAAGDQQYSTVAMDNLGHVVVVWSGNGADDRAGVYMQRFETLGANVEGHAAGDSFNPDGCADHDHEHADDHDHDHGEHGDNHEHDQDEGRHNVGQPGTESPAAGATALPGGVQPAPQDVASGRATRARDALAFWVSPEDEDHPASSSVENGTNDDAPSGVLLDGSGSWIDTTEATKRAGRGTGAAVTSLRDRVAVEAIDAVFGRGAEEFSLFP